MASNFPTSIDAFTNPVNTKIDGEDVVSAAHVNDLQDAVRAVQEVVTGAGKPLDMLSNRYIADNTSFKLMLEALDVGIGVISDDLTTHKALVLITDLVQHHSNVIDVTPIGNLASSRVQTALEEHQVDINNIMSGSLVEGITLDDRYVNKVGAQQMQGPLTVTGSFTVGGNTTLGNAPGDIVAIADGLTVGGDISISGTINTSQDILVQSNSKIAEAGATASSYIMFGADRLEFYTHKDFIIKLDADDATDGIAQAGNFQILNGLGALVFQIDEVGDFSGSNGSLQSLVSTNGLTVGGLEVAHYNEKLLDTDSSVFHLQLDRAADPLKTTARFLITQDGDTGANLASVDLLFNVDETSTVISGISKLKSGIQETGYFGMKVMSGNAGGEFHGMGVNFKKVMTNIPSSITFAIDAASINQSNLSVTHIDQYGFFFEFDTLAIGAAMVRGTYTTLGN